MRASSLGMVRAAATVAPATAPPSMRDVSTLYTLIRSSNNLCVLTGAGCSTESNIPDYRSPTHGAYSRGHKPMTHQQFMGTEAARRRYWSRSFAGWSVFSASQPNSGHTSLAKLEENGFVQNLITQNVDRLHHKAGSRRILEIHGTTHEVICMHCGDLTPREEMQERLRRANTFLQDFETAGGGFAGVPYGGGSEEKDANAVRPDGDLDITATWEQDMILPSCKKCGGVLKPDVVFFGDNVPPEKAVGATQAVEMADTVLVVGSSLQVFSAYRLVKKAVEEKKKVVLLTVGETRADDLVPSTYKIEARAGEMLSRLLLHENGTLNLPKGMSDDYSRFAS